MIQPQFKKGGQPNIQAHVLKRIISKNQELLYSPRQQLFNVFYAIKLTELNKDINQIQIGLMFDSI